MKRIKVDQMVERKKAAMHTHTQTQTNVVYSSLVSL